MMERKTEYPQWTDQLLKDLRVAPGKADLHTHTRISDGCETPFGLCRAARAAGVTHLAITDHDHLLSRQEARRLSLEACLDVIPGVELNVGHTVLGQRINPHLGILWAPEDNEEFQKILAWNQGLDRAAYVKAMLTKLLKAGVDPSGRGVDASYEMIVQRNQDSLYLGKGAVSQLLVDMGICQDREEAGQKYLSRGGQRIAFIAQEDYFDYADMTWVMDTVRKINDGLEEPMLVTLNHLFYYCLEPEKREALVSDFARMGGHALEVYYPIYSQEQIQELLGYCAKYDLMPSGGSDRHRPGKNFLPVAEPIFQRLLDFHMRADEKKGDLSDVR